MDNSTQARSTDKPEIVQNRSEKLSFLSLLRLRKGPCVRLYRGFGNADQWVIQGHVFGLSPMPRKRYRDNFWTNTFALLRLFMVRPLEGRPVRLRGTDCCTKTDVDGFFRFEYKPTEAVEPGWNPIIVDLMADDSKEAAVLASDENRVLVAYPTQYGFISDIDDTFLVSHSATMLKRLQVLLTENAKSRDPFEGVVSHYQYLASVCAVQGQENPFFYVSSSEWNLYDYIRVFAEHHKLPDGVLLLSQLKRFSQLLKTGQGKHHSKMDRIVRILKACPNHQFVLLGDDTQADPTIYRDVVKHYPDQIRAVYLRQVYAPHREQTAALVAEIEAAGIPCCYFAHSNIALEHSRQELG